MGDLPSRFGPFEFDPGAFKLRREGVALAVEPKALDLLGLLLARAPYIVEKAEIFSVVWRDVAVTDNALTRLVAQLRKALDDDPKAPRYIETIATRGYRFIAPLSVGVRGPAEATGPAEAGHYDRTGPASTGPAKATSPAKAGHYWGVGVAAVLVMVVGVAAWAATRFVRGGQEGSTAANPPDIEKFAALQPQQLTVGEGFDGYAAFSPDGKAVAFSSDRSGRLEIYVQGLAAGSAVTALTSNGRQNAQPAWSPDGEYIAYHEMAGDGIWVVPSRGGVARKIADFGSRPTWSPDGRLIAFQSLPANDLNPVNFPGARSTIWVVEAKGRTPPQPVTTAGEPAGPHLSPSWAGNSRELYFVASTNPASSGGASLWIVDLQEKHPRQLTAHKRFTPEYVVAPDGGGVYFAARETNSIWWLPLGGEDGPGEPRPTGLPAVGSTLAQLAVSPDGRRLAWTTLDSSLHVWATRAAAPGAAPLTQGLGVWFGTPVVASDGRIALAGSRPGTFTSTFLLAPGAALRQLTTDPPNHSGPRWMPGEKEIAIITAHGDHPGFWAVDPDTGRERPLFLLSDIPLPPGASQPSTAAPSANIAITNDFSRLVMAVVKDGVSNLWMARLQHFRPEGALVQRTFEREGGSYPTWSPDGRWIAYQCNSGTSTNVCVINAENGERTELTHDVGQSWVGGWASDNDRVLFAARRDGVWNVATVSRTTKIVHMLTHFTEPRGYVRYPRWDALNDRVVFERADTTARLWSVELPR